MAERTLYLCNECGFFEADDKKAFCKKQGKHLQDFNSSDLNNNVPIPDWCPLDKPIKLHFEFGHICFNTTSGYCVFRPYPSLLCNNCHDQAILIAYASGDEKYIEERVRAFSEAIEFQKEQSNENK